jgi:DNA invertase Pin-like site-specific DNA recombinase
MRRNGSLRAGLYERVSTGTRSTPDSRSLRRQNKASLNAIERHEWTLADRYPDPGISASRFARVSERPEWSRLLADIRARKLDVVVLWESSRGDRKMATWATFVDECRDSGTLIYITNNDHLYDPAKDYEDYKTLLTAGVDSAHEAEKISSRTRDGIALSATEGDPHGKVPFGYTRRYELQTGERHKIIQEPHPTEAPVVRRILTDLANGKPKTTIANELERDGIPSASGSPRWHQKSIARLALLGYCYIGKRMYAGSLLDGNWPAIVDEDIFWRAHDRAKSTKGTAPGKTAYLLSYLARCECGAYLSPRVSGFPAPIYRCVAGHTSAPAAWLDGIVANAFVRWTAEPGRIEEFVRDDNREADAARYQAKAEQARLDEFRAKAVSGDIGADDFAVVAAGIRERIRELEAKASELASPPALRGLLATARESETPYRRLAVLAEWDEMPVAAQREAIAAVTVPVLHRAGNDRLALDRVSLEFH